MGKTVDSDTLIVTELSGLGRSASEVIALVNGLVQRNVCKLIIKQNLDTIKHDVSSKSIVARFSCHRFNVRDLPVREKTLKCIHVMQICGRFLVRPHHQECKLTAGRRSIISRKSTVVG